MLDYDVAQTVVCVDDKNIGSPQFYTSLPEEGKRYIVRKIWTPPVDDPKKGFGVSLHGITGTYNPDFKRECAFRASRFRPLDDLDLYIEKMEHDIVSGNYDKSLDLEDNPYRVEEPVSINSKEITCSQLSRPLTTCCPTSEAMITSTLITRKITSSSITSSILPTPSITLSKRNVVGSSFIKMVGLWLDAFISFLTSMNVLKR
jgi:hypothetical protein